jgi:hypothetical protein
MWYSIDGLILPLHFSKPRFEKNEKQVYEIDFLLTREPPQLILSVWAHILLIGGAHSVDKNPKRIRPIAALIPNYSRFTELLAYDKVCTRDRNESKKVGLDSTRFWPYSTRLDSTHTLRKPYSTRLDSVWSLIDSTRLDSTQNRNDRRYNFLQTVRISDKINIVQKNTSWERKSSR